VVGHAVGDYKIADLRRPKPRRAAPAMMNAIPAATPLRPSEPVRGSWPVEDVVGVVVPSVVTVASVLPVFLTVVDVVPSVATVDDELSMVVDVVDACVDVVVDGCVVIVVDG
jgi:hypothetical protein